MSFRTLADRVTKDAGSPLNNSLIAEKLINGHVATQVLAIRRLMDRTKNTISLRRLLTDIRSNYALFTRKNYICHDGLPCDYESMMQAEILERAGTTPSEEPRAARRRGRLRKWRTSGLIGCQVSHPPTVRARTDFRVRFSIGLKVGWTRVTRTN